MLYVPVSETIVFMQTRLCVLNLVYACLYCNGRYFMLQHLKDISVKLV